MIVNKENKSRFDPIKQLDLLKLQCQRITPKLYETQEKYLELIRSYLQADVRQAVFNLITDMDRQNIEISSLGDKKVCLEKIDILVNKSISRINIKNLIDISDDIEKEKNLKIKQSQKKLINDLEILKEDNNIPPGVDNQSIRICSDSPLEDSKILSRRFFSPQEPFSKSLNLKSDYFDKKKTINTSKTQTDQSSRKVLRSSQDKALKAIKNFFKISSNRLNSNFSLNNNSDITNERILSKDITSENISNETNQVQGSDCVPDNPLDLFNWLTSIDMGLIRELRNLSNSINVELLSVGLINNIMPLSLLDAVISGQINTQDAPSNLLRISVPLNGAYIEEGIEVVCVFIRPSELEFDHYSLRECRLSLKNRRSTLLKMVRQYRHWTNKSLANEISQQWLEKPLKSNQINTTKKP